MALVGLCCNPNITMTDVIDIIDTYPDKPWDWECISSNGLNYKQCYINEARRVLMAYRIQLHW